MGDLLFAISKWLYYSPLNPIAQRISESRLSGWILSWFWAIPIMQTIHILAISATLASILMLNLRVFGLAGHASLEETAHRYTRVLGYSLIFVVITGVGMLFGDTTRNLLNSIFWIKMILLVVSCSIALVYSRSLVRQTAGGVEFASAGAKVTGILLVVMWCTMILAGRWIAYAPS
jgi:hypothetical protein